ncbi:MAG: hypothetical protein LUQ21_06305, partial [Methanothrix sp.]|nr:hypothetical protein [Methanothrix sp.]
QRYNINFNGNFYIEDRHYGELQMKSAALLRHVYFQLSAMANQIRGAQDCARLLKPELWA